MPHALSKLIQVIDVTIARLAGDVSYAWGHMGSCNCGHLLQTITNLDQHEIHRIAMERDGKDWAARATEFCPTSGMPIDGLIDEMLKLGMNLDDIAALERLDDPAVVQRVGRHLERNSKDDFVAYLAAWRAVLVERAKVVELPRPEERDQLNARFAKVSNNR